MVRIGTKPFSIDSHLHPYIDSFDKVANHKDIVLELIQKAQIYNKTYIEELELI